MTLVNRPAFQQAAGDLFTRRPLGSTIEGIEKGSQGSNERDQTGEKGAEREERDRRREIERSMRDGRRYGEKCKVGRYRRTRLGQR
jgi:hypothetical protein